MVVLCAGFVFHLDRVAIYNVKDDYYYYVLFVGNSMLVVMWLLAVTLTMMGGLLREKAAGTSAFTLALPVSRARLATVRICTGLAQAFALARLLPLWKAASTGAAFHCNRLAGLSHRCLQIPRKGTRQRIRRSGSVPVKSDFRLAARIWVWDKAFRLDLGPCFQPEMDSRHLRSRHFCWEH
jgi:hypothetical protein